MEFQIKEKVLINRKTQELQFYVFVRLFISLIHTKLYVKHIYLFVIRIIINFCNFTYLL